MAQKKKLQVFVSSTYTDLREERQAAVEAILTAGHIPAGMELFAAGDESQMKVIKRWIDESDVYLLILGGRYGSLEPKTQKSYIHLEYEYAIEKGKPFFAIVINEEFAKERVKAHPLGVGVFETENAAKLKEFRAQVASKMVRFWRDSKDIKLAILETMSEFSRREDLTGWVQGGESVNAGALAEEIARLGKENAELRERLSRVPAVAPSFDSLSFEEMYRLLSITSVDVTRLQERSAENMQKAAVIFGDVEVGLIHAFWIMSKWFQRSAPIKDNHGYEQELAFKLVDFGLVEYLPIMSVNTRFKMTERGGRFLLKLMLERDANEAEQYIL